MVIRIANYPDQLGPSGKLALKLPDIGSSTVQCYGFYNFKSGVVEGFRRR